MSLPKTPSKLPNSASTPEGKKLKVSAPKEETGKVLQGFPQIVMATGGNHSPFTVFLDLRFQDTLASFPNTLVSVKSKAVPFIVF